MSTRKWKKTKCPGVYVRDGRYKVRAACRVDGKIKQREQTLPEGTSEADALRALVSLRELLQDEVDPSFERVESLEDYAVRWIKGHASRSRASTVSQNTSVLSCHILPVLGELPVTEIHRADVQRWVRWAEAQRKTNGDLYSTRTLNAWWRILRALLRDAAADLDLEHDPLRRVKPPKGARRTERSRELRTLTAEELWTLVEAVREVAPQRYAEIFTLAYTGMRAGELYALPWDNVDAKKRLIDVQFSVARGEVNTTKTDDPRIVAVPELVVEVLEEHRKDLVRKQHPGLKLGICFPSDTGGYRRPSSLRKPLASAAKLAGIGQKVSAQVLRRTYNTILTLAQVDRLVVRAQVGHSSEEMTDRYSRGGIPLEARRAAISGLVVTSVVTREGEGD